MNRTAIVNRARRLAAALALACVPAMAAAQGSGIERPDASVLQHGDLVWPKNPKSIVPYDSSAASTSDAQKRQWEAERNAFVARVRDPKSGAGKDMLQLATNMEALTYTEFQVRYLAGVSPLDIVKYGGGDDLLYVGHVGIIEVAPDGKRFVIEAVWGSVKAVQRVAYEDWLKQRADSWVWVGRIRDLNAQAGAAFVAQAKSYIGKPYDFWNFDLADESGFYCSKLVWLSLVRAAKVAVDDNPDPGRMFWLSPKQVWNSVRMMRINVPREYAY